MPIRRRPASRPTRSVTSAQTWVQMLPTVRQPIRISWVIAVLEQWVASQATWSSKARV